LGCSQNAIRYRAGPGSGRGLGQPRHMERTMKQVALCEIKDDLSKYLRLAENEEIVITRHGKPAGILVGFASEDEWFDYTLEHDPRFLARIGRLWRDNRGCIINSERIRRWNRRWNLQLRRG